MRSTARANRLLRRIRRSVRPAHCMTRVVYPDGSSIRTILPWEEPTLDEKRTPSGKPLLQLFMKAESIDLKMWKGVSVATALDSSALSKFRKKFGDDSDTSKGSSKRSKS